METKSQRLMPFSAHKQAGRELSRLTRDSHDFVGALRASKKAVRIGTKGVEWLNRLQAILDAQLLRDFPDKYRREIYFPAESAPAPEPETTPGPQLVSAPEPESMPAPEPTLQPEIADREILIER
jgi:hypothetical protein